MISSHFHLYPQFIYELFHILYIDVFNVDHAMVCRRGGFIIQRHNELRDLEADMLSMVCNDVEIEPVLQELTGESLSKRS